MSGIRDFLLHQLAAGSWSLGQVRVEPGIRLLHVDDSEVTELEGFRRPEDARELAKYDDAGRYRPLKTAPNLRRGWQMTLGSADDLRLALDLFYPAALGTWLALAGNALGAVSLRETLGRQTGMYRVTALIRDDQAESLIEKTCREGCLRERLWRIDSVEVPRQPPIFPGAAVPILCAEACNLLVAACRPLAKENLPKTA